jgi:hypothetical protein
MEYAPMINKIPYHLLTEHGFRGANAEHALLCCQRIYIYSVISNNKIQIQDTRKHLHVSTVIPIPRVLPQRNPNASCLSRTQI